MPDKMITAAAKAADHGTFRRGDWVAIGSFMAFPPIRFGAVRRPRAEVRTGAVISSGRQDGISPYVRRNTATTAVAPSWPLPGRYMSTIR